jgi:hypothetical protein
MPDTYQQGFQQPQWNTDTGAMLCDADVNVTATTVAGALPAGTALIGNVGLTIPAGATPFNVRATSTAGAGITATQPAATGQQNYLLGYQVCLRSGGAPNDVGISLQDGTTEKVYDVIGAGAPSGTRCTLDPQLPIVAGTENTAMNLVVGAAGSATIIEVSMWGYTV